MLGYLCGDGVRPGGEELGDAGGVEASLRQAKGGSKSRSSGSHHHRVKLVVHDRILGGDLGTVR